MNSLKLYLSGELSLDEAIEMMARRYASADGQEWSHLRIGQRYGYIHKMACAWEAMLDCADNRAASQEYPDSVHKERD